MPIEDAEINRHKFILMYDDETVMDAAAALRDADGQEWWTLLVDLGSHRYAAGPFSAITETARGARNKNFFDFHLSSLIGAALHLVEVVVEQSETDLLDVRVRTEDSSSHTAVILKDGEVRGVIVAGLTRGSGLFDTGLVGLAGQYAEIPKQGTLSKRRQKIKRPADKGK